MTGILSRRAVGITGAVTAASLAVLYSFAPVSFYATTTMANSSKPVDLSRIGKNMVKKVPSMEEVKLESVWQESTVVLTFLRRFG